MSYVQADVTLFQEKAQCEAGNILVPPFFKKTLSVYPHPWGHVPEMGSLKNPQCTEQPSSKPKGFYPFPAADKVGTTPGTASSAFRIIDWAIAGALNVRMKLKNHTPCQVCFFKHIFPPEVEARNNPGLQ